MKSITSILLVIAVARVSGAQQLHVAPSDAPSRIALADSAERGTRLTVSGRVIGADGRPVPAASIYAYQTDTNGEYVRGTSGGSDRPRLFAYLRTDAQGRYSFTTVKPGSYPNSRNPAHIHFEVTAPGLEDRNYEIVFENDPYLSAAFRSQAEVPFGGVEIVRARTVANGALEVTHDMRLKTR